MEINGGCLCGAVRYTADGDPTNATVCHCRDCQKFTGSVFATQVRVDKETMNIEGALKTFSSIGGSGNPILRHFCPECGSSIAEESAKQPGTIVLNVDFPDPELDNHAEAYWGVNLSRLSKVKAAFDPSSVFTPPRNQGIPQPA